MQAALDWAPGALRQQLGALLPDLELQFLASTDSTSTRLVDRARAGLLTPCLLVAEAQTAGRGRNGRRWLSRPGASLTFSLALALAPQDWSGLSLAIGVALADAIEPLAPDQPPRLLLKWPTDLWLADGSQAWRKLGGVLVEAVSAGAQRVCVVGIGLNVTAQPVAEVSSGYAHLQELLPGIDAPTALAVTAPALVQALQRFESQGFAGCADAYSHRDLLRGRNVSTTSATAAGGVARGVDSSGALLLEHGGVHHRLVSGEVSVRPAGRLTGVPASVPTSESA